MTEPLRASLLAMAIRQSPIRSLPLTLAAFLALGLSVPVACNSPSDVNGTGGTNSATGGRGNNQTAPCNIADVSLCGGACEETPDCPSGLYCDSALGTCQAECVAGQEAPATCASGAICLSDGRCGTLSSGGTGGDHGDIVFPGAGGWGMGGDPNEPCIDVDVDFDPQIPAVVLLIDQSASMNEGDGFGAAVDDAIDAGTYEPWDCDSSYDWRWNVVRNVLLHPETGVVAPLEDRIRFGLSLYSSNNGGENCPLLTTVDLALNNQEAMLSEFVCDDTVSDTPTRESLTATAEALALEEVSGDKVIVLATDGAPDNCTCYNWEGDGVPAPDGCDEEAKLQEQADVVAEAARIHDELGIVVHVVDVSSPSQTDLRAHLTDVAAAGGGDLFDGTDPGGLAEAFSTITEEAQSCAIDLNGSIAAGKESSGTVLLDGEELELDGADGWTVNSPTQIELLGQACEATKSGQATIDITFPCGSFRVK